MYQCLLNERKFASLWGTDESLVLGVTVTASFEIQGPTAGILRVGLFGHLEEPVATRLEEELAHVLAPVAAAGLRGVVVDLCGLEECHVFARTVLVRVQKLFATKAKRTAYLADRPRFRGLALWVMHLADDSNAKAVMNEQQATDWLDGTSERLADAVARTETQLAKGVRR